MNKFGVFLIAVLINALATASSAEEGNEFAIMWIGQIHEHADPASVDALVTEVAHTVSTNDGTLYFEISRVGNQLFGYERFADLNGMLAQFELVGPLYPRINEAWAPVTIVPTTAVPPEVTEILKDFNALVPDSLLGQSG